MNKSEIKVIGALKQEGRFASAQTLHQLLRKSGESTGLATVYRTLQKAAAENTVDVLRTDEGEALYRLCETGHHHHLICTSCGKTVEVEEWANNMAKENGFRQVRHVVELFGTCAKC